MWVAKFHYRTKKQLGDRTNHLTVYTEVYLDPSIPLWQHQLDEKLVAQDGREYRRSDILGEVQYVETKAG